jgi:short-subunit dehydrogenase
MVAWSEALRYEVSRFCIDVIVICPGRVETAFFDHETFRSRVRRPETRMTVPVETVSKKTIQAIERRRSLTYVPSYYALIVWIFQALPFAIGPIYARLLSRRIDTLYKNRSAES